MSKDDQYGEGLKCLAQLDRTIHEPARLLILAILYVVKSADFLYLEKQTGMTRGNLSSHLSKLEAARYISVEKKFVDKIPRTLYHLSRPGRKAFQAYRQQVMDALSELPD